MEMESILNDLERDVHVMCERSQHVQTPSISAFLASLDAAATSGSSAPRLFRTQKTPSTAGESRFCPCVLIQRSSDVFGECVDVYRHLCPFSGSVKSATTTPRAQSINPASEQSGESAVATTSSTAQCAVDSVRAASSAILAHQQMSDGRHGPSPDALTSLTTLPVSQAARITHSSCEHAMHTHDLQP